MRKINVRSITKIGGIVVLSMLMAAFSATANAGCFGSFEKVASIAQASAKAQTLTVQVKLPDPKSPAAGAVSDSAAVPSIVGFWHVHYIFPFMDQEAYQTFELGGTETHNPNTPTDGVCLGAWTVMPGGTVKLTHRVWLYENGIFQGVGHLDANITLGDKGSTQSGTFTFQVYDLGGSPVSPQFQGTLSGERITPN
jgi:hypothetical protein